MQRLANEPYMPNVNAALYHIRFSSQRFDDGYCARDAVRRFLDLSGGKQLDYGALIGVAAIRLPYWL